MTVFRPPGLDKNVPIVDLKNNGCITPYMQRFWQNLSFTAADGANLSVNVTNKVDKNTSAGWGAITGTADKTTFATYTAPTVSSPPTQAEVQALANHVQTLSRHIKAITDGLVAASVFST